MPPSPHTASRPVTHGAAQLPCVHVDAYNAELRDDDGLVGDRANERAFEAILDEWRERLAGITGDPLGEEPTGHVVKQLDEVLAKGDVKSAGLVHSAIESFAQNLAGVIRRLMQLPAWHGTQRVAVGGGLRASRIGEIAIGRAAVLLQAETGHPCELQPIRHHPDAAGLIGAVHLIPPKMLAGADAMLAVDIGGTSIRAGLVALNRKKAADLSAAQVTARERWRHRDDSPARDQVVDRLAAMLRNLVGEAEQQGLRLGALVGIGCPGLIRADGSIETGAQNLPGGDWESRDFNLPARIREQLPDIGGEATVVLMHNDAVVQGLSDLHCMQDVARWGILTIGTGLGNARFTNSTPPR